MATLHAFDTLAYTKALVERGYERDKAEALAEAQREFFVKELASEDFVKAEIEKSTAKLEGRIGQLDNKIEQEVTKLDSKIEQEVAKLDNKIELEISQLEKRMMLAIGKMLAFAVGVILAGIPIIQAVINRLG